MSLHDATTLPAVVPITSAAPAIRRRTLVDWLYVCAFGAIGWPWLLRSLSGGTTTARAKLLEDLALAPDALPALGSWRADSGYLTIVAAQIAAQRPALVVELGGGVSTLIAAKALQRHGGGRLITVDHIAGCTATTRDALHAVGLDAEFRTAPLARSPGGWPGQWYPEAGMRLPVTAKIDLLLVDGPPWALHPFGRGAAASLFDRIAVGGVVLLDDAARPGERVVAQRWRRRWPNFTFTLDRSGTKGTLIGKRLR